MQAGNRAEDDITSSSIILIPSLGCVVVVQILNEKVCFLIKRKSKIQRRRHLLTKVKLIESIFGRKEIITARLKRFFSLGKLYVTI